jgi:hypothetical protein
MSRLARCEAYSSGPLNLGSFAGMAASCASETHLWPVLYFCPWKQIIGRLTKPLKLLERLSGCNPRSMNRERLLCALVVSMLTCCLPAAAQEKGNWRAANSTAQSITGDVSLSAEKISISFSGFPIARIRSLQPGEISAVFDAESNANGTGSLYRLSIPASKKFLHRNSLCGAEDTQWMATYVAGRSLHLAFFSSQQAPVFTLDAIMNSTDLCGVFAYVQ